MLPACKGLLVAARTAPFLAVLAGEENLSASGIARTGRLLHLGQRVTAQGSLRAEGWRRPQPEQWRPAGTRYGFIFYLHGIHCGLNGPD